MTTQGELPDIVERLLPCPCCKTVASLTDNTVIGGWFVVCENAKCGLRSGIFPTKPMAIRTWNTRATPPGSPLEREGWKLVPIEPTQAMLDAVTASDQAWPFNDATMRGVYTAMVEDAPSPSPTEREGE